MKNQRLLLVGLISITLIALELVWTRIFSAEFFYTFAFLILSLAIMGLGLGGLALRLFSPLNREGAVGVVLVLAGLTAIAGPPLVFILGLQFSTIFKSWLMAGKLVLTVIILSSSFFFGGIALSKIFKDYNREIPRLYMADLLGAGLGAAAAIVFMNWFGTPVTTFLVAIPILIAAFIVSRKFLKAVPVILAAAALVLCWFAPGLLTVDRPERAPVIYTHWDAMSKIKLYDNNGIYRGINIDNIANSPVYPFDGDWNKPDSEMYQYGIDVGYLIGQFDSCAFLSLGAGGGVDVLQALQYGANEVHAVEVNGHINDMMLDGDSSGYILNDSITEIVTLPEYTGGIYHDPRVRVATEDARAYVKRFRNHFDVIYSLSSNSWAALASGAFALAENYLFTTEAFKDYWASLSDRGFMMMEHQFYMPRLVTEVMQALDEMGVENPGEHFAVYNLPNMRRNMILISKRPLNDEIRLNAFGQLTPQDQGYHYLLYPADDTLSDNLINQIVLNGWQSLADTSAIDLSPSTDNRPFIAQMGLWKNFKLENLDRVLPYEFFGFPLSKIIIIIILLILLVLIIPLNLLPYFMKGEKLRAVPWLYFFVIGMAFMSVEIILIQKYGLFIGPSVYSIIAVLLTLLIASGLGSRFARRIGNGMAFIGIIVWLILDIFVFRYIIYGLGDLTILPRVFITAILIFPLGFFMGMPFPKATLKVGPLIDWGFAVNGAASVFGSTMIILVAFNFGFNAALLIGAFLYLLAYVLISQDRAWR